MTFMFIFIYSSIYVAAVLFTYHVVDVISWSMFQLQAVNVKSSNRYQHIWALSCDALLFCASCFMLQVNGTLNLGIKIVLIINNFLSGELQFVILIFFLNTDASTICGNIHRHKKSLNVSLVDTYLYIIL